MEEGKSVTVPEPRPITTIKQEAQPLWIQLAELQYNIELAHRKQVTLVDKLHKLGLEAEHRQLLDRQKEGVKDDAAVQKEKA